MALTNAFREAVKTGNVRRIRIMMKDSLLTDPTFQHLKEMEQAASSIQGLYDPHDGKEFEQNVQKWNDDYMNRQMVRVVSNFSHERIAHLKEVVRYLRPVSETAKKSSQEMEITRLLQLRGQRSLQGLSWEQPLEQQQL